MISQFEHSNYDVVYHAENGRSIKILKNLLRGLCVALNFFKEIISYLWDFQSCDIQSSLVFDSLNGRSGHCDLKSTHLALGCMDRIAVY